MSSFIDEDNDIQGLSEANKKLGGDLTDKTRAVHGLVVDLNPLATFNEFENIDLAVDEEINFNSVRKIDDKASSHFRESYGGSPCSPKPLCLCSTHFYCKTKDYAALENIIKNHLITLHDAAFSHFPEQQVFKCRFVCGSNSREMHLTVFYDAARADHLLEVRRIHGDGIFGCGSDLFANLKKIILPNEVVPAVRPRGPLSVPKHLLQGTNETTAETFFQHAHPAFQMAQDQLYEPRLEGLKMLCDLCNKDTVLLSYPPFLQHLVSTLVRAMHDPFEDVRELAIVTIECYSRCVAACRGAFLDSQTILENLIASLEMPSEEEYYLKIHAVRRAVEALVLMANDNSRSVCLQLQSAGFSGLSAWRNFASQFNGDHKLQDSFRQLERVFVH